MRILGHREGNNTHRDRWRVGGEGRGGPEEGGELGRDNTRRNA